MDKVLAIATKEIKSYLSPGFLFVCGIITSVMGFTFYRYLYNFNSTLQNQIYQMQIPKQAMNIHYAVFLQHLSLLNLLLIMAVPAVTMRLFSEEKKMRTFDLLLTSPITSLHIILGKYLAGLGAVLLIMLIALLYPISTIFFAKLNWATLLIAFMGIFLVSAVYVAMDMFCSALTESIFISYIMAVIFNVAIWLMSAGADYSDSSGMRKFFEHFSLAQHLSSLVEGTIRTSTLIFFASVIVLFAFLAERVVESARWR